jgi:HD superfamily phosphodiesterase
VHCLEVASRFAHDDDLQVIERELGIVASLLHDIGKTQTLTPNQNRSDLGVLIDHNHLRHVWTWASEVINDCVQVTVLTKDSVSKQGESA